MKYNSLAISDPDKLIYGVSPNPVSTRHGMVIGGGTVYPELNFTLPDIKIEHASMPEITRHYQQIVEGALKRAAELEARDPSAND
jgi:methanol--5-hydroxybenzimidazolylcobamide Co-methyltransferase